MAAHPASARGQAVRAAGIADQIVDRLSLLDHQPVGDEAPVTAPGNGFRAKHRDGAAAREGQQAARSGAEPGSEHVVGVVAKPGVAEAGPFLRLRRLRPPPGQLEYGLVPDPCLFESAGKPRLAKMRKGSRCANLANVGDDRDAIRGKEPHEVAQRPGGMADGDDARVSQVRSRLRMVLRTVS